MYVFFTHLNLLRRLTLLVSVGPGRRSQPKRRRSNTLQLVGHRHGLCHGDLNDLRLALFIPHGWTFLDNSHDLRDPLFNPGVLAPAKAPLNAGIKEWITKVMAIVKKGPSMWNEKGKTEIIKITMASAMSMADKLKSIATSALRL
jgi:hypothetical protein